MRRLHTGCEGEHRHLPYYFSKYNSIVRSLDELLEDLGTNHRVPRTHEPRSAVLLEDWAHVNVHRLHFHQDWTSCYTDQKDREDHHENLKEVAYSSECQENDSPLADLTRIGDLWMGARRIRRRTIRRRTIRRNCVSQSHCLQLPIKSWTPVITRMRKRERERDQHVDVHKTQVFDQVFWIWMIYDFLRIGSRNLERWEIYVEHYLSIIWNLSKSLNLSDHPWGFTSWVSAVWCKR